MPVIQCDEVNGLCKPFLESIEAGYLEILHNTHLENDLQATVHPSYHIAERGCVAAFQS